MPNKASYFPHSASGIVMFHGKGANAPSIIPLNHSSIVSSMSRLHPLPIALSLPFQLCMRGIIYGQSFTCFGSHHYRVRRHAPNAGSHQRHCQRDGADGSWCLSLAHLRRPGSPKTWSRPTACTHLGLFDGLLLLTM